MLPEGTHPHNNKGSQALARATKGIVETQDGSGKLAAALESRQHRSASSS
jgi:hypothetical protein